MTPISIADELRRLLAEGRTNELLGQWLSANASRIIDALPDVDVEDCAQAIFTAGDDWDGSEDCDTVRAIAVIRLVRPDAIC